MVDKENGYVHVLCNFLILCPPSNTYTLSDECSTLSAIFSAVYTIGMVWGEPMELSC